MLQKIAMLSYHTCPLASAEGKETGGMNVYVLELSKRLAERGYHVDMFTRCHDDDNEKVTQIAPNLRLMHLISGPTDGSVTKKELIRHLDGFTDTFLAFAEAENLEYDLLHCHYYLSGLIGVKVQEVYSKSKKIPTIMTFHTLALMKNLVARGQRERESQKRIDAEYQLAQNTDHIITPSESARDYLTYLYDAPSEKISVIPPGFNHDLFRPIDKSQAKLKIDADQDHKIILFVGRIEPLKGIDVLMYAMKILTRRNPEMTVCLWVLGGDISQDVSEWSQELQRLEQLRETLRISAFVKFVGQKPQDELPYYYNSAEVVVMPSNYESFGMAALESMACGVPVITTNVAGISRFLDDEHKALVTSAHNPLLLAERIEHLLGDEVAHTRLGKEIHDKVNELSWENVASRIEEVYKTVW